MGNDSFQLPSRRSTPNEENSEVDIPNLLKRVQRLERSSTSTPAYGLSESGLDDSQIILNKTRMLNWSFRMGTAEELTTVLACYTQYTDERYTKPKHADGGKSIDMDPPQNNETEALVAQISDLLHNCKRLAKSMKIGRPTRSISQNNPSLSLPSREEADAMVTLYFQCFESTHRILHVPSFWAEYHRYWENPEDTPIALRLKILLVVGIGSSLHRYENDEEADARFRNMAHQWVYAAQTWLAGPLEKGRLNITGLQIHCLTILARQSFSIGADLLWMSMGSLVHTAMQMGLHRDPVHLPGMSVLQAEMRRRTWATILELVIQCSLDSAMPPRISLDEFDTQIPSNSNDDDINESTAVLKSHPRNIYTSTSQQLLLLDSLPLRLRIVQLLTSFHSELPYPETLALSSKTTEALRKSSQFMKEHSKSGVTSFHRNLLDYLVRRVLIPLHCPFASKARKDPSFHYSLEVNLNTAMAIISPEPDEYFSRLMAIGGGLFREGMRYAGTVISIELLAHVEAQSLDGTLHRSSQQRELLKQVMKDIISWESERIRLGETNVKGHMFLNMIMAQVEAVELGISRELNIAQSAKESLEFSHGLLLQRHGLAASEPNNQGLASEDFAGMHESYGLDFDMDHDFDFFSADTRFS
ncbi:Transcription factor lepE [Lachnellula suecica]|uniref:Transcription factor lepE n=1 Tax=Lachnellula suecica TaxID=602035 RepID=A0A8T9BY27_9HELO|nr:Transcription factor lepE [Lachnellula suecica]